MKAGSGCVMTIGEMLRSFLTKLEWFSTLFPRIPVPIQKEVDAKLKLRPRRISAKMAGKMVGEPESRLEASAYQRPRYNKSANGLTPENSHLVDIGIKSLLFKCYSSI